MEDSFSVRVDKIFGSLPTGKNSASSDGAQPLWRLTDEEVEARKWNRRKDRQQEEEEDKELLRSAFVNPKPKVEADEDDEDEEEVEEIDGAKSKRRRNNVDKSAAAVADEDDWNVGANIGRDCTLDYEDEEDEYDKVAIGLEQNSDRLYMKDVKSTDDQVSELNTYDYLRDPSKYTRYTIDSSVGMNDDSNKEAYMNYFQYLRKPNAVYSSEGDTSVDAPKSVRFTPKNKREGESIVKRNEREDRENRKNKGWSIGVTAEITQEHEASSMEEDRPYVADDSSSSFQKPSRQYRARN